MSSIKNINDYEFIGVKPSDKKHKKYDAIFKHKTKHKIFTVSFGAAGMYDFILWYDFFKNHEHLKPAKALAKAEIKKRAYLARHINEDYYNFNNWYKPSFWAANLLWGDIPNLKKQLAIIRHKYNF